MSSDHPTLQSDNADERKSIIGAPAWLDIPFIQKVLAIETRRKEEDFRVKKLAFYRATEPGENYSSTIYRAEVTLEESSTVRSLLIKLPPDGETVAKSILDSGVFEKESNMLANHIPIMKELLDGVAPGRFPPFTARCLLHGSSPEPFLVLEDLKTQGFRIADRHRGLDLRHCLMAVRSLARFHAASAALLASNETITEKLFNPMRGSGASWDDYCKMLLQLTADACKEWEGYGEYYEALIRFIPKSWEAVRETRDPLPGRFNVICHGDFWVNNIMFKYEDGRVTDIRMVDLQLSHVASPAIDLLYFLYTSTSEEALEKYEDLILREYHEVLRQTMELVHRKAPTFEELLEDINTVGVFGLFSACVVLPIVKAQQAPNHKTATTEGIGRIGFMYKNPIYHQSLQRMLPRFKEKGWLKV